MQLLSSIEPNIIAFCILLLIYLNERKMKKQPNANRIFMTLVYANMIMTVVDILGWVFNGLPGKSAYTLNLLSNALLYTLAIIPASMWLIYVDSHVFRDRSRFKKWLIVLIALASVNMLLVIASIFNGWYFFIDAANIYHRNTGFWLHTALCYSVHLMTTCLIIFNHKIIDKHDFILLLLFPVPLIVGSLLQIIFYGLSLTWIGMALSVLIIYINIQKTGLNTDYLTGVYNRRMFDYYLEERIINSTANKTFSAIMIDLDRFKLINDTLGHRAGDAALEDAVAIFRSSLPGNGFIARYGGDEFCIILITSSMEQLEKTVNSINHAAENFNLKNKKPYWISFSMGYDIYDYTRKMNPDEFIKHMDQLMYSQKEKNKLLAETPH